MKSTAGNDINAYYSRITVQLYSIVGSTLASISGGVLDYVYSKNDAKKPGCIYFIEYNVANLFGMLLTLLPVVVANIIDLDQTVNSVSFCKINIYLRLVLPVLSRYYLILASMD
jgi:hypothetical protein